MKLCPKCKKEFTDNDNFCGTCGIKLEIKSLVEKELILNPPYVTYFNSAGALHTKMGTLLKDFQIYYECYKIEKGNVFNPHIHLNLWSNNPYQQSLGDLTYWWKVKKWSGAFDEAYKLILEENIYYINQNELLIDSVSDKIHGTSFGKFYFANYTILEFARLIKEKNNRLFPILLTKSEHLEFAAIVMTSVQTKANKYGIPKEILFRDWPLGVHGEDDSKRWNHYLDLGNTCIT